MESSIREKLKAATHEEAMKRFRVANEDLTPVIQAARFGFDAGWDGALGQVVEELRQRAEKLRHQAALAENGGEQDGR